MHFVTGASDRHTVPSNTHQLVLSGLTSGTTYRVSLQAASRQGLGPAAVKYYTTQRSLSIAHYLDFLQYNSRCVTYTFYIQ